ncbi:MAG: sporulation protein YabP [Clostridia bacterium]|nr:sporulation protein YabP [Clostridia bacterium]
MAISDDKKMTKPKTQNLILENREKLSISGVLDVESFNDECVVVDTELGVLIINGEDLHINKLNLDNSELIIEGLVSSCEYSDKESSKSKGLGFLGRMFK